MPEVPIDAVADLAMFYLLAHAYSSLPPKPDSSRRNTLRMSRKIDAASSGAVLMSLLRRRRWKSNAINPAKMMRPTTE